MNYYKINYGNDNEIYDFILENHNSYGLHIFKKEVHYLLKKKLQLLLEDNSLNNISTFNWVESSIEDFHKIGYDFVNHECYTIKYAKNDGNKSYSINETIVRHSDRREKDQNILFEICMISEFESDAIYSSYLFSNYKNTIKFESEINLFLESNFLIENNEVQSYLNLLEVSIQKKGFELISPVIYSIFCDHRNKLPMQWVDILGEELFKKINLITPLQNKLDINSNNNLDLPF